MNNATNLLTTTTITKLKASQFKFSNEFKNAYVLVEYKGKSFKILDGYKWSFYALECENGYMYASDSLQDIKEMLRYEYTLIK